MEEWQLVVSFSPTFIKQLMKIGMTSGDYYYYDHK